MKIIKFAGRIIPALLLCVMFYSCEESSEPEKIETDPSALPAIDVPWNENNSIVCFGTSLTYGFLPSMAWDDGPIVPAMLDQRDFNINFSYPDSSYPNLLGKKLKIKVYNQGYVGGTLNTAFQYVYDSVLSRKPALVLLEFGANDFFQHVPAAQTEAKLDSLIRVLQSGGAKVALLSFVHPDMANYVGNIEGYTVEEALAYYEALGKAAEKNGIPFMNYLFKGVWARYDLMSSDFVHPNTKGYTQMAENVFAAFKPTFEKNGMIK